MAQQWYAFYHPQTQDAWWVQATSPVSAQTAARAYLERTGVGASDLSAIDVYESTPPEGYLSTGRQIVGSAQTSQGESPFGGAKTIPGGAGVSKPQKAIWNKWLNTTVYPRGADGEQVYLGPLRDMPVSLLFEDRAEADSMFNAWGVSGTRGTGGSGDLDTKTISQMFGGDGPPDWFIDTLGGDRSPGKLRDVSTLAAIVRQATAARSQSVSRLEAGDWGTGGMGDTGGVPPGPQPYSGMPPEPGGTRPPVPRGMPQPPGGVRPVPRTAQPGPQPPGSTLPQPPSGMPPEPGDVPPVPPEPDGVPLPPQPWTGPRPPMPGGTRPPVPQPPSGMPPEPGDVPPVPPEPDGVPPVPQPWTGPRPPMPGWTRPPVPQPPSGMPLPPQPGGMPLPPQPGGMPLPPQPGGTRPPVPQPLSTDAIIDVFDALGNSGAFTPAELEEIAAFLAAVSVAETDTTGTAKLPPIPTSLIQKADLYQRTTAEDGQGGTVTAMQRFANTAVDQILGMYESSRQRAAARGQSLVGVQTPQERDRLAQIAATGGLSGYGYDGKSLSPEQLAEQQRRLSLIGASGGLRGDTNDMTADQLAQQQRYIEGIKASGGLRGMTPFDMTADQFAQQQQALARGGLSADQRLAEIGAGQQGGMLSTLAQLLSNPSALGTLEARGVGLDALLRQFGGVGGQGAPPTPPPAPSPWGGPPPYEGPGGGWGGEPALGLPLFRQNTWGEPALGAPVWGAPDESLQPHRWGEGPGDPVHDMGNLQRLSTGVPSYATMAPGAPPPGIGAPALGAPAERFRPSPGIGAPESLGQPHSWGAPALGPPDRSSTLPLRDYGTARRAPQSGGILGPGNNLGPAGGVGPWGSKPAAAPRANTLADIGDWDDEELEWQQGRAAASGITPSGFQKRARAVTPFGGTSVRRGGYAEIQ